MALALSLSAVVFGCTSESPTQDKRPTPVSWQRLLLPGGLTPVTLTPMPNSILVGARHETARLAPRLLVLRGESWSEVPLRPESFYADRARWRSVVTDGERVFAFGDAPGGAHSNPRWTTWAGTLSGVREYPQFFDTFGGWGAGGLTGMTLYRGQPLIFGSWTSESSGLDIAVWVSEGNDWVRRSSAGSALEASRRKLTVIRSVGTDPSRLAVSGAVVELDDGEVHLRPAMWRGELARSSWVRTDLPATGAGEATGVRCGADECLAAGYVDEELAVWSVKGELAELADVPDVSVTAESMALVGPPGSDASAVLASSSGRSVIVANDSDDWSLTRGPVGTATAWAFAEGRTYVITTRDGRSALWAADLF